VLSPPFLFLSCITRLRSVFYGLEVISLQSLDPDFPLLYLPWTDDTPLLGTILRPGGQVSLACNGFNL